jgi:preprotein translocase subunit SecG
MVVFLIQFTMFMTALFLIVLILLQRGRGGGLAGALGGMGGQSAFGSKAGDAFTKITSVVAIFWILLCIGSLKYMRSTVNLFSPTAGAAATRDPDPSLSAERNGANGETGAADDDDSAKGAASDRGNSAKTPKKKPSSKDASGKTAGEPAGTND